MKFDWEKGESRCNAISKQATTNKQTTEVLLCGGEAGVPTVIKRRETREGRQRGKGHHLTRYIVTYSTYSKQGNQANARKREKEKKRHPSLIDQS